MVLPVLISMRPSGPVGVPFQPPICPELQSLPLRLIAPPLLTVMLAPAAIVIVRYAVGIS